MISRWLVRGTIGLGLTMAVSASATQAHEFWISPHKGRLLPDQKLVADLKVGLALNGTPYPYLSNRFRAFNVRVRQQSAAVNGSEGDMPALNMPSSREGLQIVSHQTVPFRTTHKTWAGFLRFLREEGLDRYEVEHRHRGLPEHGFSERYTRYAKALVQVGTVRNDDQDDAVGMALELIARANPYDDTVKSLPVVLLWRGEPLANRQINIFHRQFGTVSRVPVTTDGTGRASIPLNGKGEYLLNAVHLQSVEDASVVWHSHWATLSFKL